jgi:hypothetical protein
MEKRPIAMKIKNIQIKICSIVANKFVLQLQNTLFDVFALL